MKIGHYKDCLWQSTRKVLGGCMDIFKAVLSFTYCNLKTIGCTQMICFKGFGNLYGSAWKSKIDVFLSRLEVVFIDYNIEANSTTYWRVIFFWHDNAT